LHPSETNPRFLAHFGDSKIDQFDCFNGVLAAGYQEILRLNVPVNHASIVRPSKTGAGLRRDT
jgi:hypothetical protein